MAHAQRKKQDEKGVLLGQLNAIARRELDGAALPTDAEAKVSLTRKLKRLTVAGPLLELQRRAANLTPDEAAQKRRYLEICSSDSACDAFELPPVKLEYHFPMPSWSKPSLERLEVHSKLAEVLGGIVREAEQGPTPPVTIAQIVEREGVLACVDSEWMAQAPAELQQLFSECDHERFVVMHASHWAKWKDVPGFAEHVNGRQLVIVA